MFKTVISVQSFKLDKIFFIQNFFKVEKKNVLYEKKM